MKEGLRTWIEIDRRALRQNAERFLKLIPRKTHLMAVIKSNAYGHGLGLVAKALSILYPRPPTLNPRLWFGVDSITEALPLRRKGIKNPILVLGSILSNRVQKAAAKNIAVTISNFEQLKTLATLRKRPTFHIKIDTGMHRQGFLPQDMPEVFKLLGDLKLAPQGIYTHLAAPKRDNPKFHAYTLQQIKTFRKICGQFEAAGFKNLIRHAAATAGTILYPEAHFDMVRIGMGLYGYPPITFNGGTSDVTHFEPTHMFNPVLSWKTIVSEIKDIPKGSYVGYDMTERVRRLTKIAVLPVGYWHGYDRGLSSVGEVLVRGRRAKVLGRVSMDMIVVDVTDIQHIKVGDGVVLIGRQGKESIWADELAEKIGTTQYEFLTRINPLIKRVTI